jgi:hypothetical protein
MIEEIHPQLARRRQIPLLVALKEMPARYRSWRTGSQPPIGRRGCYSPAAALAFPASVAGTTHRPATHQREGAPRMRSIPREDAPVAIDDNGVEVRLRDEAGLSVGFVRLPAGADLRPATKGLPNDLCPCPHWGYMIKGRVRMQRLMDTRTSPPAKPSTGRRPRPRGARGLRVRRLLANRRVPAGDRAQGRQCLATDHRSASKAEAAKCPPACLCPSGCPPRGRVPPKCPARGIYGVNGVRTSAGEGQTCHPACALEGAVHGRGITHLGVAPTRVGRKPRKMRAQAFCPQRMSTELRVVFLCAR